MAPLHSAEDVERETAAADAVIVTWNPLPRELIERFGFYQRIGWARPTRWRAPLQAIARWRCRGDRYAFPVEKRVVEWLRGQA